MTAMPSPSRLRQPDDSQSVVQLTQTVGLDLRQPDDSQLVVGLTQIVGPGNAE